MLERVLKEKKKEELVYGKVLTVNLTTRKARVEMTNRTSADAAFPQSLEADISVGDIVLVGRTVGGGRVIIQKADRELPTESEIVLL
jgi:hypothetical protein